MILFIYIPTIRSHSLFSWRGAMLPLIAENAFWPRFNVWNRYLLSLLVFSHGFSVATRPSSGQFSPISPCEYGVLGSLCKRYGVERKVTSFVPEPRGIDTRCAHPATRRASVHLFSLSADLHTLLALFFLRLHVAQDICFLSSSCRVPFRTLIRCNRPFSRQRLSRDPALPRSLFFAFAPRARGTSHT